MIIESMLLKDLKPAPYNPRKSNKEQEAQLAASLKKFGVVEPIIFNKRSGHIVGGHFRVRELKKLGKKKTDCVIVDLNEEDERELNIRLNANTGDWDWDALQVHFDVNDLKDYGLETWQFVSEDDVDDFFEEAENEPKRGTTIVLDFNKADYDRVIKKFDSMDGSKESIVIELLGL